MPSTFLLFSLPVVISPVTVSSALRSPLCRTSQPSELRGSAAAMAALCVLSSSIGASARSSAKRSATRRAPLGRAAPRTAVAASSNRVEGVIPDSDVYKHVVVESEDGKLLNVEVRPRDDVQTLKAMLELDYDIPIARQVILFQGQILEDLIILCSLGLRNGSKFQLKLLEPIEASVDDDSDAPLQEVIDGVTHIRVGVSCEVKTGHVKIVNFLMSENDTIKSLKEKAMEAFGKLHTYFTKIEADEYGLFVLSQEPIKDYKGNIRALERSEHRKNSLSLKEAGLAGGDELTLVNYAFYPYL